MDTRQRVLAALDRRSPDRCPLWETTIWPETLERWYGEGLPRSVSNADPRSIERYFGLDGCACINDLFDPSFGLPERIIEETAEHRTYVDSYGKTIKVWRSASSVPQNLAPAIRDRSDWDRLRPRLTADDSRFNNPAADAQYRAARAADLFTVITPPDPVWFVLYQTMGFEHGLTAMAKDPGLFADMATAYTEYLLAMLTRTRARGYRFDALWFWSDLCYKGGLLFSPRTAARLALPHWQRLSAFAHEHGMRFIWHCDGDVSGLLPVLLEAELDAIHPLEVRAGNDARVYKQKYGDRLCLIGNIDADVLATNDRAAVEAEVAAKVPVLSHGGGYIYHTDHSVPPTVSLDTFRFTLDCVRRYGEGVRSGK